MARGPKINGERYVLVLMKVDARDAKGRPSTVTLGYDDSTFKVEEGMEFITAFVKADCVKPKPMQ